ncbi:hypothetical protein MRX96_057246 [Rhipicephalus microplus]
MGSDTRLHCPHASTYRSVHPASGIRIKRARRGLINFYAIRHIDLVLFTAGRDSTRATIEAGALARRSRWSSSWQMTRKTTRLPAGGHRGTCIIDGAGKGIEKKYGIWALRHRSVRGLLAKTKHSVASSV